jgi:hypothetical protein
VRHARGIVAEPPKRLNASEAKQAGAKVMERIARREQASAKHAAAKRLAQRKKLFDGIFYRLDRYDGLGGNAVFDGLVINRIGANVGRIFGLHEFFEVLEGFLIFG